MKNLFLYQSTCNVYVLRQGESAVLIDFGDGTVLNELLNLGINKVTAILMTHHHRDQGQGLGKAVETGIPIWVPDIEREYFSDIDWHWQGRNILNNYNVREDRFSLLHSIPIAGTLQDYEVIKFLGIEFMIHPTPGHTPGSISISCELENQQICFTGDLIAAPGKLWSLAATQWTYNGAEGAAYTALSLLRVKENGFHFLFPSHGETIDDPLKAIDTLLEPLLGLLNERGEHRSLLDRIRNPFKEITPHIYRNLTSVANSYVLVSRSGKALIIDYGYDFIGGFADGTGRASRRPWLYTIPILKQKLGVNKIDIVLPTHYHDDHVAGMNLLQRVEHTAIWAPENFAQVLSDPSRFNLPCLWFDPIKVDTVQPLEKRIQWQEFHITLYALPGHTRYAVAILVEADEKKVLFTGDEFQGDDGQLWNYVYQNRVSIDDYRMAAELFDRLRPDIILPGHWSELKTNQNYFDQLKLRAEKLISFHNEILPLENLNLGIEGFVASLTPYQSITSAGGQIEFQCEVRNPLNTPQVARARLVTPDGWLVEQLVIEKRIEANQVEILEFRVRIPGNANPVRRERVAVDLFLGNRRLGQQAEALVTIKN